MTSFFIKRWWEIKMNLNEKLKFINDLQDFLAKNPLSKQLETNIEDDFKLRYTYDSNAIEGNTLTLKETKVVLEGVTIGGKTIKEHLEVINHAEGIEFIKNLVKEKQIFSEQQIKSIHYIVLKGVDENNAGKYRTADVFVAGANHKPPHYQDVPNQMREFMQWYETNAQILHPVIKASRVHIYFVGIHPFIDGNGRTSRLLMNLELLKAGFPAINIKSDRKAEYYEALDKAHCTNNYALFDNLVADYVMMRLQEKKQFVKNYEK